jgi:hypothetical protein
MLVIEPPYATRIVQYLHGIELEFQRGDSAKVITWLEGMAAELKQLPVDSITEYKPLPLMTPPPTQKSTVNYRTCPDCNKGSIIDTSRTNEVFPQGIPVLCPVCNGTCKVAIEDVPPIADSIVNPQPNDIIDPELGIPVQHVKVVPE